MDFGMRNESAAKNKKQRAKGLGTPTLRIADFGFRIEDLHIAEFGLQIADLEF